jgi:hypothetical protein
VYLYNRVNHSPNQQGAANGLNDNLWVLGAKTKLTFGGLMAKAEIAKNFGENRTTFGTGNNANYSGWALLANLAYKADTGIGSFTPWAEYGYGSGRQRSNTNKNETFTAINSDYRPGGIYGRFDNLAATTLLGNVNSVASNGLANRTIYGIGLKATPASLAKLTTGVQYYKYAFTRTSTLAGQVSRNIGSEIDVTAEWKHSENVALKLTLGTFQPGAYVADTKGANATVNPATMAALDTFIRF